MDAPHNQSPLTMITTSTRTQAALTHLRLYCPDDAAWDAYMADLADHATDLGATQASASQIEASLVRYIVGHLFEGTNYGCWPWTTNA